MAKQILHHQELLSGAHWHVPLDLQRPISAPVADAIAQSAKEGVWVEILGTPFLLKAEHKCAADGSASVHIANSRDLGNGKVKAETLLYSAMVSCAEASRPLAWRFIFSEYLKHMLESHPNSCFAAPEPMLRGDVPLLCGFARTPCTQLLQDEQKAILTAVWAAGLRLLRICEQGVQTMKATGRFPDPDPELFIELRDWSR